MTRFLIAFMLLLAIPAQANTLQDYIYGKCLNTYGKERSYEKSHYYAPIITRVADKNGMNPQLLAAIIWYESNYNPRCCSSAGSLGLCQVMGFHFKDMGYARSEWRDPYINLTVACKLYQDYHRRMAARYHGLNEAALTQRTLVAYSMGPLAVSRGVHRTQYSRMILKDIERKPHVGNHIHE